MLIFKQNPVFVQVTSDWGTRILTRASSASSYICDGVALATERPSPGASLTASILPTIMMEAVHFKLSEKKNHGQRGKLKSTVDSNIIVITASRQHCIQLEMRQLW